MYRKMAFKPTDLKVFFAVVWVCERPVFIEYLHLPFFQLTMHASKWHDMFFQFFFCVSDLSGQLDKFLIVLSTFLIPIAKISGVK